LQFSTSSNYYRNDKFISAEKGFFYVLTTDGYYTSSQLIRHDSLGNIKWIKNISPSPLVGITTDTAGNCYLLKQNKIIKINKSGVQQWETNSAGRDGSIIYCYDKTLFTVEYSLQNYTTELNLFSTTSGTLIKNVDLHGLLQQINFDFQPTAFEIQHLIADRDTYYVAGSAFEPGYRQAFIARLGKHPINVGIQPLDRENPVYIYPIPSKGQVYICAEASIAGPITVEVSDMSSKVIFFQSQLTGFPEKYLVDITGVPPGIYSVTVQAGSERVIRRKIVIR
jgi:hypothetical protein